MYLTKQMRKKYSTTFVWGHPFSTYLSYDRFLNPFLLYAPVHILDEPPPFPPVAFVLNGWPISQPKKKQEHSNIVFTDILIFNKKIFPKK